MYVIVSLVPEGYVIGWGPMMTARKVDDDLLELDSPAKSSATLLFPSYPSTSTF
jgi:hypothetical protein